MESEQSPCANLLPSEESIEITDEDSTENNATVENTVEEGAEEGPRETIVGAAEATLDPIALMWSTIYQMCSIIAVENLDEGLSMPAGLIMTTKELLTVMPLSFSLLGIVDLIIYTILVEWAEKRSFRLAKKKKEDSAEDDDDDDDDEEEEDDSPLAEYCRFLQDDLVPVLNAKFTNNGIPSLVVKFVDELFTNSCRFSVQFDPSFRPLAHFVSNNTPSGPITALADRTVNEMYEALCGDHPPAGGPDFSYSQNDFKSNGHLHHADWHRAVNESCKIIEECVRDKYPAAVVVPCGSSIIPGTSTNQSDIDMLLVCSDIVHNNDLQWAAKEQVEDEYIALVEEAKQEYNRYATEVSANKLLEKCVRNIQEYLSRHEQQLAMYNAQYQQYQQFVMMQQQQYNAYGNRRPLPGPPPMPVKPTGIVLFFTGEDMQMMATVVQQGNILIEGVIPQTIQFQAFMGLIVDYFEDLCALFGRFLGKAEPARKEHESQVQMNNNKTLYSIRHLLEPLVIPDSDVDSPEARHYNSAVQRAKHAPLRLGDGGGRPVTDLVLRGGSVGAPSSAGVPTAGATSGKDRGRSSGSQAPKYISNLKINIQGPQSSIHFTDNNTNRKCKLEVNNLISIKNAELLRAYMDMDRSGLVRKYVGLVKIFAKAHKVCSAADGYLSSYSWTLMALHVLLRYRLIPCITPQALSAQHFCKGVDVSYVDSMSQLPVAFESRLRQLGLTQLLHLFFHYYSRVFDIEADVVSLRRPTMPKLSQAGCRMRAQSWRFSIEDPFQTAESLFPVDLGASLVNYTKQAGIFKLLNLARKGIEVSMQKSSIGYNGTINFLRSGLESIFDPTSIDRWQYS